MFNDVIALSKKLIEVPSVSGDLLSLKKVLGVASQELTDYKKTDFIKDHIPSMLFSNTGQEEKKIKIILNAHLDVVSGEASQFIPVEKDGYLYGRGAADMKTAAAVMILLFKHLASKVNYPLALQIVTDEEIGGKAGAAYQIDKGINADFVIAGEISNLAINSKAKGIINVKITAKGKTGHSAYLWTGKNAVWKLMKVLESIKSAFPVPEQESWTTTVNLSRIETANKTMNKIPDEATAYLDIRYIPEDKDNIREKLRLLIPNEYGVDILRFEPPQYTDSENLYVNALKKSIEKITCKPAETIVKHAASDIRHYNKKGIDGIIFGPIGDGQHSINERVLLSSAEQYYKILHDFILNFQ